MADWTRSWVGRLQSIGVGMIAAAATVLVLDHWRDDGNAPASVESAEVRLEGSTRVVQKVVVDRGAHARIEQLELQLRGVKAAAEPGTDQIEVSPEEARRIVEESYAEMDRVHRHDSRDPQWASQATTELASGLTALGERLGFTVSDADCKTATCKATVDWKDYTTARNSFSQLAEQTFGGLNCEQHVRLGEPVEPEGWVEGLLYLDCTDLRARMAAGISLN